MIKIYDSLKKKKIEFVPIEKNKIRMYSCGPTVYNFVHIGNLRAYTNMDIFVKTFKYFKYNVTNVMNLTDVDDKTIRDSKATESENPNVTLKKFTEKYTNIFMDELEKLNIDKPAFIPKATDCIKEMADIIQKLHKKGFAYITEDGIYYDISKNDKYGQLVKLDVDKLKYNKENRLVQDEYEKNDARDFVLWKFKRNNEPSWLIEIDGKEYEGRPGWHIECSAMSWKHLGSHFDIHSGGIDLLFPHHENEIAQSESAHGTKYANYWLHNEHLLINGKKMSKSDGTFYTLPDIEKKGFTPLALRYFLGSVGYRQQLNFTDEALEASQITIKRINDFSQLINFIVPRENEEINIEDEYFHYKDNFELALKDDFNTPKALSAFFEFENYINRNIKVLTIKDIEYVKKFLFDFNSIFSVIVDYEIPLEVLDLARNRQKLKEGKQFKESDDIRDEISKLGYEIKDYPNTVNKYLLLKKKY